jgi:hypothetical protein
MERIPNPLDQDLRKQWPSRLPSSTNGSLTPMGREMATKLVRRLLAGYPNLAAHDPEGYLAALIGAMEQYPKWAGERAVMRVDEQNKIFPPTEKVLRAWLEEFIAPMRYAHEWEEKARRQIAERREAIDDMPNFSGVKGDGGPGTIYDATMFDEAARKHGRPRGPFEPDRDGGDSLADFIP